MLSVDLNIVAIGLTVLSLLLIGSAFWAIILALRTASTALKMQEQESKGLKALHDQMTKIVLAAMAYEASNKTHPMTGPAVLQQVNRLAKEEIKEKSKVEAPPKKTGVRYTQGMTEAAGR